MWIENMDNLYSYISQDFYSKILFSFTFLFLVISWVEGIFQYRQNWIVFFERKYNTPNLDNNYKKTNKSCHCCCVSKIEDESKLLDAEEEPKTSCYGCSDLKHEDDCNFQNVKEVNYAQYYTHSKKNLTWTNQFFKSTTSALLLLLKGFFNLICFYVILIWFMIPSLVFHAVFIIYKLFQDTFGYSNEKPFINVKSANTNDKKKSLINK